MTKDLHELSEAELAAHIENAQRALRDKQEGKRKEGITKIKEIAAAIGVTVDIIESGKNTPTRKGGKVAVKYQNPANPTNRWTGRGMKPKWLRALLEQGHRLDEFAV